MVLSASFGSYPRPSALREYQIKTYGKQKKLDLVPTEEDRRQLVDATREVVADQMGLDIITDGMLTWDDYLASIAVSFDGIKMGGLIRFYDNNTYYRRPVISGSLANKEPWVKEKFDLLRELNPGAKLKAVIPGPYSLYELSEDRFYGDREDGVKALTDVLKVEIESLTADYVQIDEPSLSYGFDPAVFETVKSCLKKLANAAKGKTIISTYFGRLNSSFLELEDIADYLGIDCVSYPENYELLIKSGVKKLQLGLLDARNTKIEDEVQIKNKIMMLASDDAIISTNCGLEFLPREYAMRKLDLLKRIGNETANE
jgi:5-methyltetrahydropteroyltriglutamate--homocysteine methyltransferase